METSEHTGVQKDGLVGQKRGRKSGKSKGGKTKRSKLQHEAVVPDNSTNNTLPMPAPASSASSDEEDISNASEQYTCEEHPPPDLSDDFDDL